MTDLKFIRERLPREELLAQLAEEATELAQAALKYRRALDGKNPARVDVEYAFLAMLGEIADVGLALQALAIPEDDVAMSFIQETIQDKTKRWRRALELTRK